VKRARYGSKSYARKVLLQALRKWAKTRRAFHVALDRHTSFSSASDRNAEAFGELMGTVRALSAIGAMSEQLERYYDRRFARINHAKVTRRPFELRAVA
jgi:hypothetical protein